MMKNEKVSIGNEKNDTLPSKPCFQKSMETSRK